MKRVLGRGGVEVGALGMGTWAIGGGWGDNDDAESVRAIEAAADRGVTLFDTADVYGMGHAEMLLGRALRPVRDRVVIATKWGLRYEERAGRRVWSQDSSPEYVRGALAASLRRLGTGYVDIYQLHIDDVPPAQAEDLVAVCESLVDEGLIRGYGWSTDDVARAAVFAAGPHCWVVQHEVNVFGDPAEMFDLCDRHDLASLGRSPLAMGLLSEKVTAQSRYPAGTVRGTAPPWLTWFADGGPAPEFLARRDAIRDVLTSGGRTLAQGALAWTWARSPRCIPLAGCRSMAQVQENTGATAYGPLTPDQMAEIAQILRGR